MSSRLWQPLQHADERLLVAAPRWSQYARALRDSMTWVNNGSCSARSLYYSVAEPSKKMQHPGGGPKDLYRGGNELGARHDSMWGEPTFFVKEREARSGSALVEANNSPLPRLAYHAEFSDSVQQTLRLCLHSIIRLKASRAHCLPQFQNPHLLVS